ncbi:ArsR family transcriptional regulator [Halonotius terrestris]|uniref:ArsR family transcriptional regulator n=1 Tax=Halonotius terrestris TaxID=2487750 RepID=A0A8J8TBH8_9EURY|nr:helix-turn-helix domain-containing protein [Halonotius terrestris]TQQ81200.1 ArsR family transcriptional regulator [Halonotius terrestris]
MSSLFPLRSEEPPEPADDTRIVDIAEEAADPIVDALAAETTREILAALYEEPAPASEIAERVDTSLQNTNYHLEKLQEVGLIEVGDTWYADGGNEMNVYVPTAASLVLLAGTDATKRTVRETLGQLAGTVGMLGIGGLLVDRLVAVPELASAATTRSSGEEMMAETAEAAESAADPSLLPVAELGGVLTPGVLFALGGLFALLVVVTFAAVRRYR